MTKLFSEEQGVLECVSIILVFVMVSMVAGMGMITTNGMRNSHRALVAQNATLTAQNATMTDRLANLTQELEK